MAKAKVKSYFDDEYKAKKVWLHFEKKQSSSYIYKLKKETNTSSYHSQNFSSEVVIKITSSSKNFNTLSKHINYITRNGKLELLSNENNIFNGVDGRKNAKDFFNEINKILTENEMQRYNIKEKRETLNIVFSMNGKSNATVQQIRVAVRNTIKKKYPNNRFLIAMHDDTNNPHCHLCLKVCDDYGKRINPSKSDLIELRKNFAHELNQIGIKAKATIREKHSFKNDKKIYIKDEFINKKNKHKAHHYEVISFGKAHYKFDMENSESYYVRYRTMKGKDVEIWSDDLQRVIEENDVKKGDYCRFVITDEKAVEITIKDKKTNDIYKKTAFKKIWDVSIENKNEKILKPLSKFTKVRYEKVKDSSVDNSIIKTQTHKTTFADEINSPKLNKGIKNKEEIENKKDKSVIIHAGVT